MATVTRARRSQQERTSETRTALFEATVRVISTLGYGGASTALIADEAGVSRGAILHHFGTRAQLMADVVRWVYDRELAEYSRLGESKPVGHHISDWVDLVWEVLAKPAGFAVLEILWATRSDVELAEKVLPMQAEIEEASLATMQQSTGADRATTLATMRLIVWTVRGLSMAQALIPRPDEIREALALLRLVLKKAAPTGTIQDLNCPAA